MARTSLWWIPALLSVVAAGGGLSAQVDAAHDPGFLLPVRFDADARDDLLVRTRDGWSAWFGRSAAPFLRAGRGWRERRLQRPTGAPCVWTDAAGRSRVFEAGLGPPTDPRVWLRVLRPRSDGSVVADAVWTIDVAAAERQAAWPALAALDRAAEPAALLLWNEVVAGRAPLLRAALVAADEVPRPVILAPLPDPAPLGGWRLAGVWLIDSLRAPQGAAVALLVGASGSLAALSLDLRDARSGLPRVTGSRVLPQAPPLAPVLGHRGAIAGTTHGGFAPAPMFGVPLLAFRGGALLPLLWQVDPPYLRMSMFGLPTPRGWCLVRGATADHDADGDAEAVVLAPGADPSHDHLLILDPVPGWLAVQVYRAPPGRSQWGSGVHDFAVRHTASADLDGDGRLDLAVALRVEERGRSRIAVLRGVDRPGGQSFRPYW